MSTDKQARLAAIRAANAQKQAGVTPDAAPGAPVPVEDTAARLAAIRAANAQKQAAITPVVTTEGDNAATPPIPPVVPVTSPTIKLAPSSPAPARVAESEPGQLTAQLGPILLAAAVGAILASFALPGLSASLLGTEPKAYWYLARSTAFVAYGLLWLSMVLGLMMTNKLARLWPGGPVAFDLHQHASILGLAFGLFHALILLGDRYTNYTLGQILIPFASGGSAPFWVGLGQISLYLLAIVGLSFYVRPLIGRAGWRAIHGITFLLFGLVLYHGVWSGSDTGTAWAQALYWLSGGSVLFLTVYRVLGSLLQPAPATRPAPATVGSHEALGEA